MIKWSSWLFYNVFGYAFWATPCSFDTYGSRIGLHPETLLLNVLNLVFTLWSMCKVLRVKYLGFLSHLWIIPLANSDQQKKVMTKTFENEEQHMYPDDGWCSDEGSEEQMETWDVFMESSYVTPGVTEAGSCQIINELRFILKSEVLTGNLWCKRQFT